MESRKICANYTSFGLRGNRYRMRCTIRSLPRLTRKHNYNLWQMCTECILAFPDGVNVLSRMLRGTNEIGIAAAEKMRTA